MPAHGAEALVVKEQDPGVPVFGYRFGEDSAVHVSMAPGLPHEGGSEMIQVGRGVATLLQDGCPGDLRESIGDDP